MPQLRLSVLPHRFLLDGGVEAFGAGAARSRRGCLGACEADGKLKEFIYHLLALFYCSEPLQCRGGTSSLGISPPHPTSNSPELRRGSLSKSTFIPSFLPLRVGARCRALGFGQGGFGLQSPWDDGAVLMPRLSQNYHGTLVKATSRGPSWRARGSSVGNGGGLRHPGCPHPVSQPQATDHTAVRCLSPAHPPTRTPAPQSLFISPNPHGASCDPRVPPWEPFDGC